MTDYGYPPNPAFPPPPPPPRRTSSGFPLLTLIDTPDLDGDNIEHHS